jgi:hypothetical protein
MEDVMAARDHATSQAATGSPAAEVPTAVYAEGLLAGITGAATIALWFLLVDAVRGRPLFTPTVLGTALFRHGEGLGVPHTLPVDMEMVLTFTWVHVLAFLVIGVAASRLLGLAERNSNLGFGVVLLFVVFEFGFLLACTLFAETALQALAWPEVLVGNLLAAGAMAGVFWRRHPSLQIEP